MFDCEHHIKAPGKWNKLLQRASEMNRRKPALLYCKAELGFTPTRSLHQILSHKVAAPGIVLMQLISEFGH
jgi:hypothetical protein